MNPRGERELGEALVRYSDGRLTAAEWEELTHRLREDPAAREMLVTMAWQATTLADLQPARSTPPAAAKLVSRAVQPTPVASFARRVAPWFAAAALLALSWGIALRRERALLTVTEAHGLVMWLAGSQTRVGLQPGDRLAAGTILVNSDEGAAAFEFSDGTRLAFEGRSAAVVAENGQKSVRLLEGTLWAAVTPQPPGKHLLVWTSAAEVRVLGTEFSVTADNVRSVVNVGRGRVELKRVTDGTLVEVSPGERVEATLDAAVPLTASRETQSGNRWSATFADARPDGWMGDWQQNGEPKTGVLRAVPSLAGRKELGTFGLYHGIRYRDPAAKGRGWVRLESASRIRVRARLGESARFHVFVSTLSTPGQWGGNFRVDLPASAGTLQPGGWREFDVPVTALQPTRPEIGGSPIGSLASMLFLHTGYDDAGLEIAAVEIGP